MSLDIFNNKKELINFLFFFNDNYPLSIEDSGIGALAVRSSWEKVNNAITIGRQKDLFVKSVRGFQIYIHVPFCGRLCAFCHCDRVLLRRRFDIDTYINSLIKQFVIAAPAYQGLRATSICFGGGTPSILDESQLDRILCALDSFFHSGGRKLLFEVNPSSWTASKLSFLSQRGLSRLSIGVQTLDDKVLKSVTRSQTRKKVLWCLRSARKKGVPFINVDLMAGLPGQTVKHMINDLKVMIAEGANIIHVHPYASSSLQILCGPGESIQGFLKRRDEMMKIAREILNGSGFQRTGIGAFTKHAEGEDHQEEAYSRLEAAVAAFGTSAKGQFPGAVYYRVGSYKSSDDINEVNAVTEDSTYAMAHYAIIMMLEGMDERAFVKRFGVSFKNIFGDDLGFLQREGLVNFSKGVWKFSGSWEISSVRAYVALSRILFGQDMLSRLKMRFLKLYDPRTDYSQGRSLLKAYANSWLMSLYYRMGI